MIVIVIAAECNYTFIFFWLFDCSSVSYQLILKRLGTQPSVIRGEMHSYIYRPSFVNFSHIVWRCVPIQFPLDAVNVPKFSLNECKVVPNLLRWFTSKPNKARSCMSIDIVVISKSLLILKFNCSINFWNEKSLILRNNKHSNITKYQHFK